MPRNSRAVFPRRAGGTPPLHHNAAPERNDSIRDLDATALRLLGLKHTWLTYRFQLLEYRFTDLHGEIVLGVLF